MQTVILKSKKKRSMACNIVILESKKNAEWLATLRFYREKKNSMACNAVILVS